MTPALCAALLLGLLPLGLAMPADDGEAKFDLKRYQEDHRPLVLFAPSEDDPRAASQRERLRETSEQFEDREMILVEVYGEGSGRVGETKLSADDAKGLRKRFEVGEDDFALILVGKDGTEKMRMARPTSMEGIYGEVDRMPMRRREVRERKTPGDG